MNWDDYTEITTPADGDTALVHDVSETVVGQKMKRITWANIKAALKTYFDTLFAPITGSTAYAPLLAPIKETSGPTVLTTGAIADGEYLVRSGTTIIGGTPAGGGSSSGWNEDATNAWAYVSVDDPTGIIKINADITGEMSVGMRLKFTNGGNTIYGIITKMGTYGGDVGGYTYVTFLHEIDPTDSLALYLMANSAITNTYYSPVKAPYGFNTDPTHWTVQVIDASDRTQETPTTGTWYNLGTTNEQITIPIGVWNFNYQYFLQSYDPSSTYVDCYATLSTANNSETNPEYSGGFSVNSASGNIACTGTFNRSFVLTVASKTTYYLNSQVKYCSTAAADSITAFNSRSKMILRAICAFL